MNGFNTQSGEGVYRLQFETDSRNNYESMQALARMCVDGKEPVVRYSGGDESPLVKWISVSERLPKHFVSVLVYMPSESPLPTVHEGYLGPSGEWAAAHYVRPTDCVTHWAEMPEPPKEE